MESLNYCKILQQQGKTPEETLEILAARSRDNGRTPMQWSAEEYAGFSTAKPWILPPDNYRQINVESEQQEQDSIFSFYQQLIRLRYERPLIAEGSITFLERKNTDIIAYQRELDGEKLVVFCNFRSHEVSLQEKSLQEYTEAGFSKLLGNYEGLEKNLRPFEVAALIR